MTRILVTGGFGYVGGRIATRLLRDGHQVRIASRRKTAPDWARSAELATVEWGQDGSLAELCRGMEVVVHLAAMNEIDCARDPAGALRANGELTLRLVEAAVAEGVGRFAFFSTAHVYGAPLAGRIDEAVLPRPRHPYAISNRCGEDYVLAAHAQGRLGGLALRLSNAVGAPAGDGTERWTLLVNDLCRSAVAEGRMVMRSSGMQRRDFVPLADVEAALVHLLGLPVAQWGDGLFNLGLGRSLLVREMADLVLDRARALDPSVILERPEPAVGERADELDYRIDRLRAAGFIPGGDLVAAVDETLAFCRRYPAGAAS